MSAPECLFCKIINKETESSIEYEDENYLAFNDINPQAPTHILIIPKKHVARIADLSEDDSEMIGQMVVLAKKLAAKKKLSEKGYRLVFNNGPQAGQMVFHIHLHLLGGRKFTWPPG